MNALMPKTCELSWLFRESRLVPATLLAGALQARNVTRLWPVEWAGGPIPHSPAKTAHTGLYGSRRRVSTGQL